MLKNMSINPLCNRQISIEMRLLSEVHVAYSGPTMYRIPYLSFANKQNPKLFSVVQRNAASYPNICSQRMTVEPAC